MSHPMFDVGIEINGLKAEIESLCDRLSFAEFEWNRATDGMKERDAQIKTLRSQLANAHDACLKLCGNHSFATGHGDTVADIIGEIDGQIAKSSWQPIETAPKDGAHFWAYQERKGHFECWWYDNWPRESYWMDHVDSEPAPTHWMPLPEPPKLALSDDIGEKQ